MKETIEFIKKLWENKRTKSLSILLMYVIFFAFVFMLLSNSSSNNVVKEPEEEKVELSEITNYKLEIIGEDNFTYDSLTKQIFYDGIYYEMDNCPENLLKYNLNAFAPINIATLIEAGTLESTNYIDKSDTYVVKISDFESISFNNEVVNDDYIKISKYENKIVVDLTNYYGYIVNIELRS